MQFLWVLPSRIQRMFILFYFIFWKVSNKTPFPIGEHSPKTKQRRQLDRFDLEAATFPFPSMAARVGRVWCRHVTPIDQSPPFPPPPPLPPPPALPVVFPVSVCKLSKKKKKKKFGSATRNINPQKSSKPKGKQKVVGGGGWTGFQRRRWGAVRCGTVREDGASSGGRRGSRTPRLLLCGGGGVGWGEVGERGETRGSRSADTNTALCVPPRGGVEGAPPDLFVERLLQPG